MVMVVKAQDEHQETVPKPGKSLNPKPYQEVVDVVDEDDG